MQMVWIIGDSVSGVPSSVTTLPDIKLGVGKPVPGGGIVGFGTVGRGVVGMPPPPGRPPPPPPPGLPCAAIPTGKQRTTRRATPRRVECVHITPPPNGSIIRPNGSCSFQIL